MGVGVWLVSFRVGCEWWGVEVEAEVVCIRGAVGGIMSFASKCDFASWQRGEMDMEFGEV